MERYGGYIKYVEVTYRWLDI